MRGLALRLLALWIVPVCALLLFAARPLIGLWAGPLYAAQSSEAVYIMLVGVVFNVLDYGPQTLLEAHGKTRAIAVVRLLELVPVLAATAGLIKLFGVNGAAIGWSARFVVEAAVFTLLAYRETGLTPRPLLSGGRRQLVAIGILLVPPALALALGGSDAVVFALALVAAAAHVGYTWRTVLTSGERAWARGAVHRVVSFPRPVHWRARMV